MYSIVFSSFTKEIEIENPVFREKNKTGFYFCPKSPSATLHSFGKFSLAMQL